MNSLLDKILTFAQLSISAHNSQPFKIAMKDNELLISVDESRLLPIADPREKDLFMSLGALLETISIGLGPERKKISDVKIISNFKVKKVIATAKIIDDPNQHEDMTELLHKRFSYRGKFEKKVSVPKKIIIDDELYIFTFTNDAVLKEMGRLYDNVNFKFLSQKGYIEELSSWLRFSPKGKNWSKDGINTDAMALTPLEAKGASYVLRPKIFSLLSHLKVVKPLISELATIESSSALAIIVSKKADVINRGADFMRAWLKLTEMNLYGAPLSLLTDDDHSLHLIRNRLGLKSKETIVNILRVGPLPPKYKIPERARLSKEELQAEL